jgi:hypothetical protein
VGGASFRFRKERHPPRMVILLFLGRGVPKYTTKIALLALIQNPASEGTAFFEMYYYKNSLLALIQNPACRNVQQKLHIHKFFYFFSRNKIKYSYFLAHSKKMYYLCSRK